MRASFVNKRPPKFIAIIDKKLNRTLDLEHTTKNVITFEIRISLK